MRSKEQVFVSLVVHVCDAAGAVAPFLEEADAFLRERFEHYEIIAVENASRDGGLEALRAAAPKLSGSLSIVQLARRHKLEAAMLAGTDKSIGDYVFEIESPRIDFPLSVLDRMFEICRKGVDVVAAGPTRQPLASRLFYGLFNRVSRFPAPLTTERAGVLSRRALNALLSIDDKNRYRKALLGISGFPKEIVAYEPTRAGYRDPRSFGEKVAQAAELFTAYTDLGPKVSLVFSSLFLAFSAGMGIFAIYSWLTVKDISYGWTSLMCFLALAFSGAFLVLAVLSEYVRQILAEVQHRPIYFVKAQDRTPPLRVFDPAQSSR